MQLSSGAHALLYAASVLLIMEKSTFLHSKFASKLSHQLAQIMAFQTPYVSVFLPAYKPATSQLLTTRHSCYFQER